MARTCSKNAANFISLPANGLSAALNGLTAVTVHCWVKYTSFDAGDNATGDRSLQIQIAGTTTTGITIAQDGSGGGANQRLKIGARSVSTDALAGKTGTTNLVTGTWYGHGGVIDFTGKTITPYLNGVAEGGGAVTFANNSWTNGTPTGTDFLGGDKGTGTAQQVDGAVCEIAIWSVALNAGEMLALGKGFSPQLIRPQSLLRYFPMIGRSGSSEIDLARSAHGTVNGTVSQTDHPRMIYAVPTYLAPRAVGGGGGTAWTASFSGTITGSFNEATTTQYLRTISNNPALAFSFSGGLVGNRTQSLSNAVTLAFAFTARASGWTPITLNTTAYAASSRPSTTYTTFPLGGAVSFTTFPRPTTSWS